MKDKSFNVVGLAIALFGVVIIVTVVIAIQDASRRTTQPYTESKQLRGVHQGMVIYAQSNRGYFPGLASDGQEDSQLLDWSKALDHRVTSPTKMSLNVENRFALLVHGDYLTSEYLVSPSETDPNIKPVPEHGAFSKVHYSFAMLQIPDAGNRREEWKETLNSQAIVVSDRNTGTKSKPSGIHVDKGEPWVGHVLWNDNHVGYENIDEFETKYGAGELNQADRLFESAGTDDGMMIHAGNGKD